jgi:hypothetical protein
MSLPIIRTSGNRFINPDGSTWKYVGVSAFALWKKWLAGKAAAVQPVLDDIKHAALIGGFNGPITLRVFRYAGNNNAFAVDPWSYEERPGDVNTGRMPEVTVFTNYIDSQGFYVDWTCGDAQQVLPNPDGPRGQQQHVNEFCAALASCTNAFVQCCNEPFKNGIDTTRVVPPRFGHILTSSGQYVDSNEFRPDAGYDFVDFHPDRSVEDYPEGRVEKWLGKLFETGVYLRRFQVPIIYGEPIGAHDFDIPGRRSANVEAFRRAGLAVAMLAGMTFHSTNGLSCDPFSPVQFGCLAHFFHGAQNAIDTER